MSAMRGFIKKHPILTGPGTTIITFCIIKQFQDNSIGESLEAIRKDIEDCKVVQEAISRTLEEHSRILAEQSKALDELIYQLTTSPSVLNCLANSCGCVALKYKKNSRDAYKMPPLRTRLLSPCAEPADRCQVLKYLRHHSRLHTSTRLLWYRWSTSTSAAADEQHDDGGPLISETQQHEDASTFSALLTTISETSTDHTSFPFRLHPADIPPRKGDLVTMGDTSCKPAALPRCTVSARKPP